MNLINVLEKPQNPAAKFIEWSGSKGVWQYYDKIAKKNEELKEFYCIVVERTYTIKGYNAANQCGVYSNEVTSLRDEFNVRTFKGGMRVCGQYDQIKGKISSMGGKIANVLYCTHFKKGFEPEIVAIIMAGAALSEWIDTNLPCRGEVIKIFSENIQKKNGSNIYFVPSFKFFGDFPEKLEIAKTHAIIMQNYRVAYEQFKKIEVINDEIKNELSPNVEPSQLSEIQAINEDINNKAVDLDSILQNNEKELKKRVMPFEPIDETDLPF